MPSPTALTLAYLRRTGHLATVAESWVPHANIRRDLFGIIDIVALSVDEPILGVQATSLSNVSARLAKARQCPALALWLRHGRFWVIGWGKVADRWHPKIVEFSGADMDEHVLTRPPRRSRSRHKQGDLFSPQM